MDARHLLRVFSEQATPNQVVALLKGVRFLVGASWCYYDNGQWLTVAGNRLPGNEQVTAVDLDPSPEASPEALPEASPEEVDRSDLEEDEIKL